MADDKTKKPEPEKPAPEDSDEGLEDEIYTLTDEDGKESEFKLLANCELDGHVYLALNPSDNEDEYVILRLEKDEKGEDVLSTIEDDDEFDRVADLFDNEFSADDGEAADDADADKPAGKPADKSQDAPKKGKK